MPLPADLIRIFTNPAAIKIIATIDANCTIHAAPFGSVAPTPDESMLMFSQGVAEETPKRLEYMKQSGKKAMVVAVLIDDEKNIREGYSVCCEVGDTLTSGPLYEKGSERSLRRTGKKSKAVWTLRPIRYKTHTLGPDRGRIVTL